jgi:hypothetical protein
MASIAVMVLIETNDPVLIRHDVSTAKAAATVRRAVIKNLPRLTRVIMVTEEETARLMCHAHDLAAKAAGLDAVMPPADYIPPTND